MGKLLHHIRQHSESFCLLYHLIRLSTGGPMRGPVSISPPPFFCKIQHSVYEFFHLCSSRCVCSPLGARNSSFSVAIELWAGRSMNQG
jgi:hypothetical protein